MCRGAYGHMDTPVSKIPLQNVQWIECTGLSEPPVATVHIIAHMFKVVRCLCTPTSYRVDQRYSLDLVLQR